MHIIKNYLTQISLKISNKISRVKFLLKKANQYSANELFNILLNLINFYLFFKKKKLKFKESILIVTHDLSITGAPVVALNLIRHFKKKYNIILVSHGDGMLGNEFKLLSDHFIDAKLSRVSSTFSSFITRLIVEKYQPKFAILNSVESNYLALSLAQFYIPTVSLIHEFVSYTLPKSKYINAIFWSNQIVLPSRIIYDDLIQNFPFAKFSPVSFYPQGLAEVGFTDSFRNKSQNGKLKDFYSVNNKDAIKIIGVGYVHYRKGVDLFIDLAAKVLKENQKDIFFYWVGEGFKPDVDVTYSCYLQDQLTRYGIADRVFFLEETPMLGDLFDQADIFILTSRLDPFPNVFIKAMFHKLPILCFDLTSGAADFLKENNLKQYCVASYLDTDHMKIKLERLINSKKLRLNLGVKLHFLAKKKFSFKHYVSFIQKIADQALISVTSYRENAKILNDAEIIDVDFSFPEMKHYPDIVLTYLRAWDKIFWMRKPFSGFHPGIYAEKNKLLNKDPLIHYLGSGRPEGPWNYQVIKFEAFKPPSYSPISVALHIHVHYPDLLYEIIERLHINSIKPDLFVSLTDNSFKTEIHTILKKFTGKIRSVKLFPNIGRDIGPFLIGFGSEIFNNYEYVGHLHTKKTPHENQNAVKKWKNFLLDNLVGNKSVNTMDQILIEMNINKKIGMVFPDDPNCISWDENFDFAKILAKKMQIKFLPNHFNFPIGSMFWVRSEALKPILKMKLKYNDFPTEPLANDGTLLHALERLFPFIAEKAGYTVSSCYLNGTSR
jgi:glycosyltransferase involved in cell wall biosynthesis